MPLSEDKAVDVLLAILNRPGTILKDVPGVWAELLDVYAKRYDAPAEHNESAKIGKQNREAKPNETTAITPHKLLSADETATILGVARHTLDVWACHRNEGPAFIKVGRRRMYLPEAVEAYLQMRTVWVGEGEA